MTSEKLGEIWETLAWLSGMILISFIGYVFYNIFLICLSGFACLVYCVRLLIEIFKLKKKEKI
jgi:hypothetical protein